MPRLTVEGMKFYYQQAGEGPDVVLLHGVTGNMAIWPLIGLIPALAADFRVTAYDLRGHFKPGRFRAGHLAHTVYSSAIDGSVLGNDGGDLHRQFRANPDVPDGCKYGNR